MWIIVKWLQTETTVIPHRISATYVVWSHKLYENTSTTNTLKFNFNVNKILNATTVGPTDLPLMKTFVLFLIPTQTPRFPIHDDCEFSLTQYANLNSLRPVLLLSHPLDYNMCLLRHGTSLFYVMSFLTSRYITNYYEGARWFCTAFRGWKNRLTARVLSPILKNSYLRYLRELII